MTTVSKAYKVVHSVADGVVESICGTVERAINRGDYESAFEALRPYWNGIGAQPRLDDLAAKPSALLFLFAGIITSDVGHARRMLGAQKLARKLLNKSIDYSYYTWDSPNAPEHRIKAQLHIAITHHREGKSQKAMGILSNALTLPALKSNDLTAWIKICLVAYMHNAGDLADALALSDETHSLITKVSNQTLIGCHFNIRGGVQVALAQQTNNLALLDRAFESFTAAQINFETIGHTLFEAGALNNIGFALFTQGEYEQAHHYLSRAHGITMALDDDVFASQIKETQARVYHAQGDKVTASRLIDEVIAVFSQVGAKRLLDEALETRRLINCESVSDVQKALRSTYLKLVKKDEEWSRPVSDFTYALAADDDSLMPHLEPGSIILFTPSFGAKLGELVIIYEHNTGDSYIGFYCERNYQGEIEIGIGYSNDEFEPVYFNPSDAMVYGVAS